MQRYLFLFIIIFFVGGNSYAADPEVHISPKPTWISSYSDYNKKPSLRDIGDGYFYALSERQIHVEKKADYFHYIREIVSNTGIQNGSEISVSFDPSYERLDFHEIVVWRNNVPQNRLKLSAFKILADERDFSKFIYQGSFTANVILDDIRKGDRIEYSFTITGRNPIFNDKFCKEIYFQGGKTIAHQYISLLSSPARKLNMKLFNKAAKPVIAVGNGLRKYTWENFQVQPVFEADDQPSWYNQYNYVQVSDFSNWGEVADWAYKINPPATDIKGSLAALIAKLKAEYGKDKVAYFRGATKIVQDEVRYMGIEIGEYSHRANRPEKVYDQRYGDCKDKSLLLVSMLKANGIDANMVLVNSSLNDKIDQCIPAANAFDHAVVFAVVNGKQVWVDATISNQRGDGTDIYFPDYGKGLILKPGNAALTTISAHKTGKIICEEKFTVGGDTAKVKFNVKTVYTLDQADRIRDKLASASMAETEKSYLDYYSKTYSKIESVDSMQVIDDEHKNQLTTIEKYSIGDFYKKDSVSGKYSSDFYADYISQQLPSISNKTKTPVSVNYPYAIDYTLKVILSNGWDVTNTSNTIKRDAYQFKSDYSTTGDTLSLHYQFAYLKDYVAVDKLDEFRKDIYSLKNEGGLSYSISHSTGNPAFVLNTWMLVGTVLVFCLVIFLGIKIYRTETPGIVFTHDGSFIPIGGWLILIVIGLVVTPIKVGMTMYDSNYFSMSQWYMFSPGSDRSIFRTLLVFEALGNTIIIAYSIFCIVLMLKKRDILPKFIIGYYGFGVVFLIIDYVFALNIHNVNTTPALNAMVRTIIVSAIWIPYFIKSVRVQQTFIVPYPENNYAYEEEVQEEAL